MGNPSWVVGSNSKDAQAERNAEQRERLAKMVRRFFMKANSDTEISFVGPFESEGVKFEPFVVREHQFAVFNPQKRKTDWHNYRTCLRGNGEGRCPYCEAGIKSYVANFFTVIDHTVWKDKDGNEHKDERKLLMLKGEVADVILKQIAKRGGTLKGLRYEVTRPNDGQSNSSGTNFSFVSAQDLSGYPEDTKSAYNMFDILKPLSLEQAMAEISRVQSNGSTTSDMGSAGNGTPEQESGVDEFNEDDSRVNF